MEVNFKSVADGIEFSMLVQHVPRKAELVYYEGKRYAVRDVITVVHRQLGRHKRETNIENHQKVIIYLDDES